MAALFALIRFVFRVPTSAFRVLAKVGPDPARYRRWRKEARMSRLPMRDFERRLIHGRLSHQPARGVFTQRDSHRFLEKTPVKYLSKRPLQTLSTGLHSEYPGTPSKPEVRRCCMHRLQGEIPIQASSTWNISGSRTTSNPPVQGHVTPSCLFERPPPPSHPSRCPGGFSVLH